MIAGWPLLAAVMYLSLLPRGVALPAGGQLVAGDVTATVSGTQLTLDQASRTAIMNWQSFNIAPNELVRVLQSGPDAALLARVTGGNPTELLGRLQADGKLFLLNPRGILVGSGAVIDTAAFLASTLDVADADFLKGGPLTFQGDSAAGVVNLGRITAREGNVLLLAHTVKNAGEVTAPKGTAGLGAGTEVYLASADAPMFVIRTNLSAPDAKIGVDNAGTIAAAQAQLEAAGGSLYDLAVNHTGTIKITGVERRPDGRILLTAAGGSVAVTGTAAAHTADGSGGEILVGGGYQGKDAAVANAARTTIGPTALLDAGADTSFRAPHSALRDQAGGRVIVWADGDTRFAGHIETGAEGFAEVSGRESLAFAGTVDTHGGTLLLDPTNIEIVAGATPLPDDLTGVPWVWWSASNPGDQTLGADTLAGLLVNNRVTLQATDTLTVNAPVHGGTSGSLSLYADVINVNADIVLGASGDPLHDVELDFFGLTSLTTAAGATISAGNIRISGFPITTLNGPVKTGKLEYWDNQTPLSFTATHVANEIGAIEFIHDGADPQSVTFSGNLSVHSSTAMSARTLVIGANNLTLSAAGNLTLLGSGGFGPDSTLAASGTLRLASTGGVLVNQAGAGVLGGVTGRQLLYTSTTAAGSGFDLGGLAGYTRFSGVTFGNDPQTGLDQVLYRADGLLTITADAKTRTYGQPDPAFTATYSGGTAAELTTLPTFSILEGEHRNVGAYTIVPSGAADDYYDFAYANGTLTIDPATLTYVATPATRTTAGANPAFTGTVTGFVDGDTQATTTTGTLTFSTPATSSSPAGAYALTGSGLTALHNNYVFAQAPANATAFTITEAGLLVITADSFSRTYGQPDPVFTATYSGGTVADLTTLPNFSIAEGEHRNVGLYTIVPSGAASSTHALSYQNGILQIDPAILTYVANPATRTLTGSDPAFGGAVTGFVAGDTLESATTGTLAFATTATSSSPIGAHALTGSGLTALHGNYTFAQAPANATAFTISPAALLTIAANDFTKTYGQPDPVFTASYAGGTVADLTTLPSFNIAEGEHRNVGLYTIMPFGAASATHTLAYENGTLRIDPAVLTYIANPASRLYGEANPSFSGTITGFVAGDTLENATTGTLAFTSPAIAASNAGAHPIEGGGLTANHGNYLFAQASENYSALTVNKAPLTATLHDATRVYGAANPEFTATFTGFRNGDTAASLDGFLTGAAAFPWSPAGTYEINGGGTDTNYLITYVPATLTVTPAPLTLTVNPLTFTFGATLPTPTFSVSGFVNDDPASAFSGVQFDTTALASLAPGSYLLLPSSLGTAQNYAVATVVPGQLTVNPRTVTIAANAVSIYAGLLPTLTANANFTPAPGGPQFTLGVETGRITLDGQGTPHYSPVEITTHSPAGSYVLTPVVVPAAGTSLEEVERYYNFNRLNATLTLTEPPVDVFILKDYNPNTEIILNPIDLKIELNTDLTKLDFDLPESKVIVGSTRAPLSTLTFSNVVRESRNDLLAGVRAIVTRGLTREEIDRGMMHEVAGVTPEEQQVLFDLYKGKMTIEQAAERMATDPVVRSVLMPLIMEDLTNALASGAALTPAQNLLAERMTARVNEERERIATDARNEYRTWTAELNRQMEQGGTNSLFDLRLMPDIAGKVQMEVMNDNLSTLAAGLGIGGAGGAAAGSAAVAATFALASKIFIPFAEKTVEAGVMAGVSTAQMAAWASSGVAISVTAGVLIIATAVTELVESENNRASYQALLTHNDQRIGSLQSLNLKDAQQQLEFARAFAGAFGETFAPSNP